MSLMTEALERISSYCNIKKTGRSRKEVEKQLSFFPFQLADEAYEYYQWAGAPTGDCMPDGWDGSYNDNSTYKFIPEYFLRFPSDVIHFLSIEEAEQCHRHDYGPTYFPFVSYEYGWLFLIGSETPVATSPVMQGEEDRECKLWFPSLTNMVLAIAESLETLGSIWPPSIPRHDPRYEDGDVYIDRDEEREQWQTLAAIAQKYGSFHGIIVTN